MLDDHAARARGDRKEEKCLESGFFKGGAPHRSRSLARSLTLATDDSVRRRFSTPNLLSLFGRTFLSPSFAFPFLLFLFSFSAHNLGFFPFPPSHFPSTLLRRNETANKTNRQNGALPRPRGRGLRAPRRRRGSPPRLWPDGDGLRRKALLLRRAPPPRAAPERRRPRQRAPERAADGRQGPGRQQRKQQQQGEPFFAFVAFLASAAGRQVFVAFSSSGEQSSSSSPRGQVFLPFAAPSLGQQVEGGQAAGPAEPEQQQQRRQRQQRQQQAAGEQGPQPGPRGQEGARPGPRRPGTRSCCPGARSRQR